MNIFNKKTQVEKFDKMGIIYEKVCDTCRKDKKSPQIYWGNFKTFEAKNKRTCVFAQWEQASCNSLKKILSFLFLLEYIIYL